jgi:hypothetical protein
MRVLLSRHMLEDAGLPNWRGKAVERHIPLGGFVL